MDANEWRAKFMIELKLAGYLHRAARPGEDIIVFTKF